jgi:hypothetical protein
MSSCGHMMFITDGKKTVHRNERCGNACERWDNRVLGRKVKITTYYSKKKNQESNIELGYNKQYISIINNQIDKLLYENKNLLILFNQQNNNIKLDKLLVIQNILDHNKNIIHNIIYQQKKIQSCENYIYIKQDTIDNILSDIKKLTNNINTIKKMIK